MRYIVCITAVLVGLLGQAKAQTSVIHRIDGARGSTSLHTIGVVSSAIEVWVFTLPDFPDIEVGRLFQLYKHGSHIILGGGYATTWTKTSQYFAMPWVNYTGSFGKFKSTINLASYVPLNDGPTVFFSDESSLTWQAQDGLEVGLAASFWQQKAASSPIRFGPMVKTSLSKNILLSARALLLGSKSRDSYRAEFTFTF